MPYPHKQNFSEEWPDQGRRVCSQLSPAAAFELQRCLAALKVPHSTSIHNQESHESSPQSVQLWLPLAGKFPQQLATGACPEAGDVYPCKEARGYVINIPEL